MIITDEHALRVKCEPILPEEIGSLVMQLESELAQSAKMGRIGIGLAAPQIEVAKNVAIVRIDDRYSVNLVNCKIKNAYDKTIFRNEGCLSYKDRYEDTMRYQEIHVVDNAVFPHSFIATGLMAVVIQHELDHLNGILLPDNAIAKPRKVKIGPNDPCGCGRPDPLTGKIRKFKKCCGK